jgi:hypothetical protein
MKKEKILFFLILISAFLLRFYNFSQRVTFGPEQAISLITSGNMIRGDLGLLGQENVQRITSDGHKLFSGVFFTYSLIPIQYMFNFQILPITAYFSVLNIFTGLILFFVVKSLFSSRIALISMFLFLFSSLMIYHSLFIWILNYLPLVGILSYYFIVKFRKRNSFFYLSFLGFLTGLGFSLEYVYLFFAFFVLILVTRFSNKKLLSFFIFFICAIIPNLPLLIFDLRNNFYHFHTLLKYTQDVFQGKSHAGITYYHFLPFLPLIFIFFSIFLENFSRKYRLVLPIFVIFYVYFNLTSRLVSFTGPTGVPSDLVVSNIMRVSEIISKDCPSNFNVVVINDFDTRGHILRYPLEFIFNCHPNSVEDYPNSQSLYILTPRDYNFENSAPWEVRSFSYTFGEELLNVGEKYKLVRLYK